MIDESTTSGTTNSTQRQETRKNVGRYQWLMEDIISAGVKTKVLLLSATQVNNQLADLRNQISFIAVGMCTQRHSNTAFAEKLNISSVKETSRQAQTHFTNWAKKPPGQRKTRDLLAAIGGDFFKLLDGLSIARSRSQVATYYAGEMKTLGGFPHRPAPKAIHAPIDLERRFLSFEQLDTEISGLRLALYHPTSFLRDDLQPTVRAAYDNKILGGFTQEGRERILIAMMKVNFLKRQKALWTRSVSRSTHHRRINILEERITAFEKHLDTNPHLDYDSLTPISLKIDFDEEVSSVVAVVSSRSSKMPEKLKAVRTDRTQAVLLRRPNAAKRDGKLTELKAFIQDKVRHPTINRDGKANRKVLVFTAFADTARYLHEHLDPWARKELKIHTGLVCGDGGSAASLGRTDYDGVLANFSPIAKRRADQAARFSNQKEEIDLLIATDCISEGRLRIVIC